MLTGVFVALGLKALLGTTLFVVFRIALALVFVFPLPVIAPGTLAAFADAILGRAERVTGAEALPSRRAGWSLQLPDGRFAEYVLWNPWGDLVAGKRYTVTIGARSRVLVAEPVEEQP